MRLLLLLLGKIHEFNSFISSNITVNKREKKQSICSDRRFLKIHGFISFILPKTTVTFRTLYFFVFVHFICSYSSTRPWLVKCTTKIWLRTRNKLANIHYFAGFGRPRGYSVYHHNQHHPPTQYKFSKGFQAC